MKISKLILAALLAAITGSSPVAQDTETDEQQTAPAETEAQTPAPEADPETPVQADQIDAESAVSSATMERFKPSEDISADRSVAFPNDI